MQSQAVADSRRQSETIASSRRQLYPIASVRSGIRVGRRQLQAIAHSHSESLRYRYVLMSETVILFCV